ncbi:helix-turn-helix domain-containing protein [Chitinolyticbacter meiyuanensis]|uniref:helix-turn-helix domain-containing protein n=1 Tax=Chitinolyticbacter meiyuanensis TaxID=682798 RepID=UPI001651D299|nr:helix-turn-helix domain-containing protein [Chitinolyticbacter meiyuanensis]
MMQHSHADLTLNELAAAACYSSWHFVRAFEEEIGEAPFEYLRKRRLFSGAYRLLTEPTTAVSTLAADCGFLHASSFAKGFRRQFGMNARDWRAGGWQDWLRDQPWPQDGLPQHARSPDVEHDASRVQAIDPASLQIEIIPAQAVVYHRFRDTWGDRLHDAVQRSLRNSPFPVSRFFGARHDLLHLRGPSESCYDLCIPVDAKLPIPANLGRTTLFGGLYATRQLSPHEPYLSWRSLVSSWPARSRFVLDTRRPMIEMYAGVSEYLRCNTLYLPLSLR